MIKFMAKTTSFLKTAWLGKAPTWFYIAVISFVYILLVSGSFALLIPEGGHDDGLQLHLSESLSKGHWLGTYNNLTLAKGIAYPAWTALLHTIDVPLWLGNAVLFILACLSIVWAARTLVRNRWLQIAVYSFLLFNPLVSPREYRDSIAPAIILFILAWVIGLFLAVTDLSKTKNKPATSACERDIKIYTVIGVISLPFWWYLREDYFWALPFIVVALIVSVGIIVFGYKKHIVSPAQLRLVLFAALLPFLATLLCGTAMATVNKQLYGRFIVNDYMSHDFQEAYGALTRIKDDNWQITVPVSRDMREKAYAVSPAFKELQSCLDNNGKGACESFILNVRAKGDYEGGWFFWALRQAVQEQGYYLNAAKAEAYYVRLAKEINSACDTGKLSCEYGERASLSAPFTSKTIPPTLSRLPAAFSFVIMLNDVENIHTAKPADYSADKQAMADYLGVRYSSGQMNLGARIKEKGLNLITKIYKVASPIFFVLACLWLLGLTMRKSSYVAFWRQTLIAWGLLVLIALRVIMITYVDATSFPAIGTFYFSSLYPILFLFEAIMISSLLQELAARKKQTANRSKIS